MALCFHVGCPFTGRGVCYCRHGTPASLRSPAAAAVYSQQAQAAWEFWQDPSEALGRHDTVELLLPRLVKVERLVRKPRDVAAEEGLPTRKDAERAVHAASRLAEQMAIRAAKLAAAAGLDYVLPEGLDIELPPVEKVDTSELEQAVEASYRRQAAGQAEALQRTTAAPTASEATAVSMGSKGAPALSAGAERTSSRQAARAAAVAAAAAAAAASSPSDVVQPSKPLRVKVKAASPTSGGKAGGPKVVQLDMAAFPEGYQLRGPSKKHPPKAWCLRMKDYKPSLAGKMVQLYWPDDGQWWPAMVMSVTGTDRRASLYYETGDEETTDLAPLIKAGEVAWLFGPGGSKSLGPAAPEDAARNEGAAGGSKRSRDHAADAGEAGESESEEEAEPVLLRLRHVTKRQRQAAASRRMATDGVGGGAVSTGSGGAGRGQGQGQDREAAAGGGPQSPAAGQLGSQPGMAPWDAASGPSHPFALGSNAGGGAAAAGGGVQGAARPGPGSDGIPPSAPSAMRELLGLGSMAVGRTVQLRLGSIQQPFFGVVADVLPEVQQVRVQLGGRYAALDARDEGYKFLVYLA